MTATLTGTIRNQQIILDRPIPQEYNGAIISIEVSSPADSMSAQERLSALEALSGRGGSIFPDDVNSYIRSIRDDNR